MKKLLAILTIILLSCNLFASEEAYIADDSEIEELLLKEKKPVNTTIKKSKKTPSISYREKTAMALMKSLSQHVFTPAGKHTVSSSASYRAKGLRLDIRRETVKGQLKETLTLISANTLWKMKDGQWLASSISTAQLSEVLGKLNYHGYKLNRLEIITQNKANYKEALRLLATLNIQGRALAGQGTEANITLNLRKEEN